MRIARPIFIVTAAALFTACGAVLALEPLTFDDEATITDGGTLDVDGGPPVQDVVTVPSDAGDAGEASGASFCAADANDFCDDFEGKRAIQGNWTAFFAIGTATAAIEAGTLLTQMTPSDAAALEVPRVSFALDQPWSPGTLGGRRTIDIRFRALIDECPDYGTVEPVGVGLNQKSVQVVLQRQLNDCIAVLREIVEPGPVYRTSTPLLAAVGTWEDYRVELPANAAGIGGDAKLTIGAQMVTLALTATPEPTRLYAVFGLIQGSYYGANGRVRLDDFRIDYLK